MISRPVYAKDTGHPWERRERGHHVRNLDTLWFVQKLLPKRKSVCNQKWSVLMGSRQQKDVPPGEWGGTPGRAVPKVKSPSWVGRMVPLPLGCFHIF